MHKKTKLALIAGAMACLSACGLQEQMVNFMAMQTQINKTIMETCQCDTAAATNYEISTSGRQGSVQIIGSEIASKATAANTIARALEKNVPDFCKFDEFFLVFINKGRSETFSVQHCKVIPVKSNG